MARRVAHEVVCRTPPAKRAAALARYVVAAAAICWYSPQAVLAGPPFRTDDPEPVEFHHWEFYGASQIISGPEGLAGTAPQIEVNYGAFPKTQIHVIIPLAFNRPHAGMSSYGPGDAEVGVKYRFVEERSAIPQIGVFPLLEIPTGNSKKNLGTGCAQIFLPVWLQKSWGTWATYGGVGYLVDMKPDPANSWFMGLEGQHDFSEILTLGAELFSALIPSTTSENEVAFSIGAIVNFSEMHHFLFSAGRDIVGRNDLSFYAAYQRTIGGSRDQ